MSNIRFIDYFSDGELDIDEKYSNISLVSVELIESDKILKLTLESDAMIEEEFIKNIEEYFKEKFNLRKIDISTKYSNIKDFESVYGDYKANIYDYILNTIPSSNCWLEDLEIEVNNNDMILIPDRKFVCHTLEKAEVINSIYNKIKRDLGIEVNIKIDSTQTIDNGEEFINEVLEEEKSISKEMTKDIKITKPTSEKNQSSSSGTYSIGKKILKDTIPIGSINNETGDGAIEGEVFNISYKEIKGGKYIVELDLSDATGSITAKTFLQNKAFEEFNNNIKEGTFIKLYGDINYDSFSRCIVLMIKSLMILEGKKSKEDKSEEKRVELHLHSNMSSMDGLNTFSDLAKRAKQWGHTAIALTDHGVVQGFPEAKYAAMDLDLKILYGLEGYLVDDTKEIVANFDREKTYNEYIVFDIETTGLSIKNDKITEIGAVKIVDNEIVDRYSQLINPERTIPEVVVELTGITDDMVRDEPTIDKVIYGFKDFIGDGVLVAHNANFDIGFIRREFNAIDIELDSPVLDTLELSRSLFPELNRHRLNIIAKHLGIELLNHHRAVDDAEATAKIFLKSMEILRNNGVHTFEEINDLVDSKDVYKGFPSHIIILAKNMVGLKNLYKLVSESHLNYFYRTPRIPKTLLNKYREGLILGSACEAGELYKAILENKSDDAIRSIANYYDYLEIQPLGNNQHLLERGILNDIEELKDINKKIVQLGEDLNKLVVATGDVHFLDPEDEAYRRILMSGQGFSDANKQPPLYFKTTDEMLEEFNYLGEEKAREVVITNTNKVADMVDKMLPIPNETFPPIIEGSDVELRELCYETAKEKYGDPMPELVKKRLDRELNSIIGNNYAVMYIIAEKLVKSSNADGYVVGSRGSVGSSFAATMSGITEVNPLVPHYICPNCKYSEFIEDGSVGSGIDLPPKNCPNCNEVLNRDGHDIPFEVFLGFEGDKEPDIDLNFAGEYQPQAHKFVEELFGQDYVFRAGTIGTIAQKTAYGFVKKYFEGEGSYVHPAEINRLVKGCTGIKRTSGQHPGGIMIVPDYKEIHDFTPIQYPANDKESGVITTHFDYHSISSNILKLDILGHDVPSMIKMLEDFTGLTIDDIPLDDKETLKIFTSIEPLNLKDEIDSKIGTLGIPEFGTRFVRQMLTDTQPTTFSELIRISGLSHGTDVWMNNAQDLVRGNIATLKEVISTRDDIMLYLIYRGMDEQSAFTIMEKVRKGKGISEEEENKMKALKIPNWYIESCKTIKYMFPKAHAAAYVTMSFRIAYFKVHYPEAFYATYFTTKVQDFDGNLILKGKDAVNNKINELEILGHNASTKEKNQLLVLEVVQEMYARGYSFENVDLYKSDSDKFLLGENGILPPLKALDGVGEIAARNVVEMRVKGEFLSIEELSSKAKLNKTAIDALKENGCLKGLPESNQLSLFNI